VARAICPQALWQRATRKLDQIDSAANVDDLKMPPGNRLELLKGDRSGQYSIRINDQYRICFGWSEQGASEVEIVDDH
jgi:proteic killer suppression protein